MKCKMRCQNLRSDLSMFGTHAGVMTPPIVLLGNCFQVFVFGLALQFSPVKPSFLYNARIIMYVFKNSLNLSVLFG